MGVCPSGPGWDINKFMSRLIPSYITSGVRASVQYSTRIYLVKTGQTLRQMIIAGRYEHCGELDLGRACLAVTCVVPWVATGRSSEGRPRARRSDQSSHW
jgi:hypothetical protein